MSNDKQQDTEVLLKIKGIPLRSDSYELIDNNSCRKEISMYDPSDNVLSPTEVVSISVFSSCGSRGSVLVLELPSVSSDTPAVDTDCTEPDLHTDNR